MIKMFWEMINGYKKTFLILFLSKVGYIFSGVFTPLIIASFVDQVLISRNLFLWSNYLLIYLSLFLLQRFFSAIDVVVWQYISNNLVVKIKENVFERFVYMKAKNLDKYSFGDIVQIINDDTRVFVRLINQNIFPLIIDFLIVVFALFMIFYINIWVGIFCTIILPIQVLIGKMISKKIETLSIKTRNASGEYISNVYEYANNYKEIKIINGDNYILNKIIFSLKKLLSINAEIALKNEKVSIINSLIQLLISIFIYVVFFFMFLNGYTSIGLFLGIIMYIEQIKGGINKIANFNINWATRKANLNKINEVYNFSTEKDLKTNKNLKIQSSQIEFKNISFKYNDGLSVFENFNLTIEGGKTTAIIGENGSGKSTIASLLLRLYEPDTGSIYIDGQDIKYNSLISLRKNISIVPQNFNFIGETIRENFLYSNSSTSDEEIFNACRLANVYDLISSLPNGLDTNVWKENNYIFSNGQMQRIAIAIALVKNTPIIIFDEATSAVDDESERMINQTIENIKKDKTIIIIAHKEQVIKHCDYVKKIN